LDNRYPRNNGPFLLHLVEKHHDRRLVHPAPTRRGSADVTAAASTSSTTCTAATSTTSTNNATTTARVQPVTATTGYDIMNNTMMLVVSLQNLVEDEEY